jgi:hypothetical protein
MQKMWERWPGALCNPLGMLILDTFHGQNCVLVVIPGGMTSQLIPLNVLVSKPFEDHLRTEYKAWLLSENLSLIPSSKINWASASELAEWILPIWKKIPGKIMEQSFKKCITDVQICVNRKKFYV